MDSVVRIEDVKGMLLAGLTYRQISEELKHQYPLNSGFSERSVRRFVKKNNIKAEAKAEQESIVKQSIGEVGKL